jgi:hypothetical protein
MMAIAANPLGVLRVSILEQRAALGPDEVRS